MKVSFTASLKVLKLCYSSRYAIFIITKFQHHKHLYNKVPHCEQMVFDDIWEPAMKFLFNNWLIIQAILIKRCFMMYTTFRIIKMNLKVIYYRVRQFSKLNKFEFLLLLLEIPFAELLHLYHHYVADLLQRESLV